MAAMGRSFTFHERKRLVGEGAGDSPARAQVAERPTDASRCSRREAEPNHRTRGSYRTSSRTPSALRRVGPALTGTARRKAERDQALSWYARQDSNLRPSD